MYIFLRQIYTEVACGRLTILVCVSVGFVQIDAVVRRRLHTVPDPLATICHGFDTPGKHDRRTMYVCKHNTTLDTVEYTRARNSNYNQSARTGP